MTTTDEQDIAQRVERLAVDAGKRKAARMYLQSPDTPTDELVAVELAERESVKARLMARFTETGQLPPGLATDLVQVANLPHVTDGRCAPPVINIGGPSRFLVTNVGPERELSSMTYEQIVDAVRLMLTPEEP